MQNISSYKEFLDKIENLDSSYLLIYKGESETSVCAYNNVAEAISKIKNINVFTVDVNIVKDIHTKYNIKSAPSLLSFNKDKFITVYKGCNDSNFYNSIFNNEFYSSNPEEKHQKSVVIYSTPSCSWCTKIKQYLKENKIRFRDIDVSKDQKAAEEMVKRSGQQGVPQTLIGGQVIIGFDKAKIDKLLNLA